MIKAENGTIEIDGGGSELGMEFLCVVIALMEGGATAEMVEETVKLAVDINETKKALGIKKLDDDALEKIANEMAMKMS